jgi:hypothetical protein
MCFWSWSCSLGSPPPELLAYLIFDWLSQPCNIVPGQWGLEDGIFDEECFQGYNPNLWLKMHNSYRKNHIPLQHQGDNSWSASTLWCVDVGWQISDVIFHSCMPWMICGILGGSLINWSPQDATTKFPRDISHYPGPFCNLVEVAHMHAFALRLTQNAVESGSFCLMCRVYMCAFRSFLSYKQVTSLQCSNTICCLQLLLLNLIMQQEMRIQFYCRELAIKALNKQLARI